MSDIIDAINQIADPARLETILEQTQARLETVRNEGREALLHDFSEKAKALGFELADLVRGVGRGKRGRPRSNGKHHDSA